MLKASIRFTQIWRPVVTPVRNRPYPIPFIDFLKNIPDTQYSRLDNGLTIATEERESYNTCVGLFIDAGSRYEDNFENGVGHFFEHLAFKGTKCRTKTLLEDQISSSGAIFKCFTTREMVAYYADCLSYDLPRVVEILTDCIYNNNFATADIELQRKIVYAEMIEQDKNSNTVLYDYLHSTAFQGTPLAQTVMGPSCNLYNFTDMTISRYLAKRFDPARTVLVAVGGVKHDQMVFLANNYLNKLTPLKCVDIGVARYTGSEIRFRNDSLPVANCVMVIEGPSFCHKDQIVMEVAASIISGWDKSQPGGINHAVRIAREASTDKFCDSYKAVNITYKDTSLWGVQFMGPSVELEDMVLSIQGEWMNMCHTITDAEVERAKRELKTKVLSKTESCAGTCHEIGRWVLYNGRRPPLHERICAIDSVFAQDIRRVCNKYIYDKCPAVAAVGPTEGLPDYTKIRAGMYWLRI
ncbi:cytochrome b-c1 complex subunit 1, mitochondrial [Bombyx mori]|uniref:Uncharacterized protein n=1 Tax=Bombyx mori TaxID=7091 RepID=A0A8R2HPF9_BOMMO|nr:cytochrome b-c1 complex subunit 1, mitochondrial [Bombyx mori]